MKASIRIQFDTLLLCAAVVSHFALNADAQNTQASKARASLEEIEAAWKHRTDTIKSLVMKGDMEQFIKGRGDTPIAENGPFTDSPPKGDRNFRIKIEYAHEQGKAAFFRSGPNLSGEDPEKMHQLTQYYTFDGHQSASLCTETGTTGTVRPLMGSIEKREVVDGHISQNADLLAVNLWLQPYRVLQDVRWDFKNMSVEEQQVEIDGIQCRRIRLPRSTPRWTSTIDVDSSRGWIPVQWETWAGGRPTMKLSIKYAVDLKAGPVVNGWVYTHYNDAREAESIRKVKVTQYQVNADVNDNRFTIQFAIGTQVSELIGGINGNRRYYVQKAGGLVPIKEQDFGRPNPESGSTRVKRSRATYVAAVERSKDAGTMSSDALRKAGFSPLAEKDSLEAWNVKPWHKNHWTIKDGVINYDGKSNGRKNKGEDNSLWTKKSYGDFEMYAEWRLPETPKLKPTPIVLYNGDFLMGDDGKRVTRPHLDAGDSGLLFRGIDKCQANIWSQDLGSGEINGYRTDRKMPPKVRRACIPIKNADRPLGEWNAFLVSLKGNRMTIDLNGERVIDADLPNLPKTGPIGLQHHGDPVQFRELWVKSLN